jgi:hypothetical protein
MASPDIARLEGIARQERAKILYAKHGLDADGITRIVLKFLAFSVPC